MNVETFLSELSKYNIHLSMEQIKQFDRYYQLLIEWNNVMNLTNIVCQEEVYLKHFYDSLSLAFTHPLSNESICDIGAGAGFPSIPLKIVFPNIKVTIVDSLGKRITFLEHLVKELQLSDVTLIHQRAEEYALTHREHFDIVSARAVARLNILSELCLPLVKINGYFITLKGSQGLEELLECGNGIQTLGGVVESKEEFLLPIIHDSRVNIYIKKLRKTPMKYPRIFGKIKKSPLK